MAVTGPASDPDSTVRVDDRTVNRWYQFVLSFPPHLVREYFDRFGVSSESLVLDPFCGTGTTLVEAKKLGVAATGFDASPMARFASSTKTNWAPDPDRLMRHAAKIADAALSELSRGGIVDEPGLSNPTVPLRRLSPDAERLLLDRSISPLPLHKALVLLDAIKGNFEPELHDHLVLAIARLLPTVVGNLRFGPEVGVGAVKADAAVVMPWLESVKVIADDLRLVGPGTASTRVVLADARRAGVHLDRGSVSAVFTSPPYPNEKDYTRTTRLESVLLGFYGNISQLRQHKRNLLRSNTRNVYKADNDSDAVAGFEPVTSLAAQIEARRLELGKTSGFEKNYHKVVLHYFGGMAQHLSDLRPRLRKGARLGYVVGDQASFFRIMIRTGHLLADIADRLGYEVESLDLFRTRFATATGEQLREEVLVLRWDG